MKIKDHYCIKFCDKCGNEEYHKLRRKIHEKIEELDSGVRPESLELQILKSLLENEK